MEGKREARSHLKLILGLPESGKIKTQSHEVVISVSTHHAELHLEKVCHTYDAKNTTPTVRH